MAKYNELLAKYAEDIARLKSLKALADEKLAKVKEHDKKDVDWQDDMAVADHYLAGQDLYQEWQDADLGFKIEAERLSQDIDAEYWDVPFAKPRKQGIEKFWELAEL